MIARPKAPSMKMYDSSTWSRFLLARLFFFVYL